jgi:hypothetical protein
MGNILIGAAIGIFVGAFAAEIIHRKNPNAFKGLGDGFSKVGNAVAKAFKDGYSGISETIEDAKVPSAS